MGYTHYFSFKDNVGKFSNEILTDIKMVLSKHDDILNVESAVDKKISFNGTLENGYEQFEICPDVTNFNFCKTAKMPYDLPVCETLLVLKHHYKDNFELDSDGFWISEDNFNKRIIEDKWMEAIRNIQDIFGYEYDFNGQISGDNKWKYYKLSVINKG